MFDGSERHQRERERENRQRKQKRLSPLNTIGPMPSLGVLTPEVGGAIGKVEMASMKARTGSGIKAEPVFVNAGKYIVNFWMSVSL